MGFVHYAITNFILLPLLAYYVLNTWFYACFVQFFYQNLLVTVIEYNKALKWRNFNFLIMRFAKFYQNIINHNNHNNQYYERLSRIS